MKRTISLCLGFLVLTNLATACSSISLPSPTSTATERPIVTVTSTEEPTATTITPTLQFTSTLTPSITASATIFYPDYPSGQVLLHQSEQIDSFNYYTYVPESLIGNEKAYILLEMTHPQIEDYEELTEFPNELLQYDLKFFAERHKIIIIQPIIPRDFSRGYYPQGINYYSLQSSTPDFYYRPDLKVNDIVDGFKTELRNAGYLIEDKIFVAGFSAGGMWANRYSILHPDKIQAVAIGHSGGWLTMPIESYQGVNLRWPMGLYDYSSLIGEEYDKYDLLKRIPMYIFIGSEDTESTYFSYYPSQSLVSIWGNSDPERLETQFHLLKELGFNVTFKMYEGIQHRYSNEIIEDVFMFLIGEK